MAIYDQKRPFWLSLMQFCLEMESSASQKVYYRSSESYLSGLTGKITQRPMLDHFGPFSGHLTQNKAIFCQNSSLKGL